ncbi:MAG: hypothetical protein IMW91_00470 [Firmicutes bacterium]|nr:hypothetical protein [Bacillota bacterium]
MRLVGMATTAGIAALSGVFLWLAGVLMVSFSAFSRQGELWGIVGTALLLVGTLVIVQQVAGYLPHAAPFTKKDSARVSDTDDEKPKLFESLTQAQEAFESGKLQVFTCAVCGEVHRLQETPAWEVCAEKLETLLGVPLVVDFRPPKSPIDVLPFWQSLAAPSLYAAWEEESRALILLGQQCHLIYPVRREVLLATQPEVSRRSLRQWYDTATGILESRRAAYEAKEQQWRALVATFTASRCFQVLAEEPPAVLRNNDHRILAVHSARGQVEVAAREVVRAFCHALGASSRGVSLADLLFEADRIWAILSAADGSVLAAMDRSGAVAVLGITPWGDVRRARAQWVVEGGRR